MPEGAPIRSRLGVLALRVGLFRLGCWLLHIDPSPMTPEEIAWAQRVAKELGL